jgi:SAM-dependent methyltransferase
MESLAVSTTTMSANGCRRLEEFLRWILKKIPVAGIQQVLDYGCGTGDLTRLLSEQLGEQVHLIGVDPFSRSIRAARLATDRARYPQIEFRTVTTERLPFREGEFDFALCTRALMHRENPLAFLDQVARMLKPGGRLLAIEMDLGGYFIAELQALPPSVLPHLNPYIARTLSTLLRDAGLEPTDLFPNFVVSRAPLTTELLNQHGQVKSLRPRLRHLDHLDFDDYVSKLQKEVATQSHGAYTTLLEVGVVARKKR